MKIFEKSSSIHLFFLFFILIHYLLPIVFVGQVIAIPHDNLEGLAYDHVISKIYKGDFQSVDLFLSGEIKWYYLEKLFYPVNILHYILDDKAFYFTNDVLKKLVAYFSFYLLAKSLQFSKFNSALGGILYSTLVYTKIPFGLALPFLPYILYLLLNKKFLQRKHLFFLFLIGLNSSLIRDIFTFSFLIPLSFVIKNKFQNFKIYFQVFSVLLIALVLSNLHLLYGSIFALPIHRETFIISNDLFFSIFTSFKNFLIDFNHKDPEFIFQAPIIFMFFVLLFFSLFAQNKQLRFLISFIFFILLLKSILGSNLLNYIFVGPLKILNGFNFQRVDTILLISYSLLFVFFVSTLNSKKIKKYLYIFSAASVFFIQVMTPLPIIGEYFIQKKIQPLKFEKIKVNVVNNNYWSAIKIILNKKNFTDNDVEFKKMTDKTFDNYFRYNEYLYIKNFVNKSRVMSIGLDPMIAVMHNIKVIDGYHAIYPMSYKLKFRKIIEKELENNLELKNYYDNWGNRVYAYYNDKNNIRLDFKYAKILGADYVISRFPIKNDGLKIICHRCNNSEQMFLYEIL